MNIYLSGPISEPYKIHYLTLTSIINKTHHKVVTPFDLDRGDTCSKKDNTFIKNRIKALADSDLVVSLCDWFEDDSSKIEIDVARKLGIEVIHQNLLKKIIINTNQTS